MFKDRFKNEFERQREETFSQHAQKMHYPPPLHGFDKFIIDGSDKWRECFSLWDRGFGVMVAALREQLLNQLKRCEWIHSIWVHGDPEPLKLANGDYDVILNPCLMRGFQGFIPVGFLIAGHNRGHFLGPADSIVFSVFVCIGFRMFTFIACRGQVSKFDLVGGDRLVVLQDQIVLPSNPATYAGEVHPASTEDLSLREVIWAFLHDRSIENNGMSGNLNAFLYTGGAMIYAAVQGADFDDSLCVQTQLKPIAHLVSAASGDVILAGGSNPLSLGSGRS